MLFLNLIQILRRIMLNGSTRVFAVIGNPIVHTASPLMHNSVYKNENLNSVYVPFLVHEDNLKAGLDGVRALGISGINVTVPYKEKVIPYLDECDEFAQKIAAVNTIVNKNGRLKGYNTDGEGFIYALNKESDCVLDGAGVVIIGAGGSSRSIAFSLSRYSLKFMCIVNRTLVKSRLLLKDIAPSFPSYALTFDDVSLLDHLSDARLVIQTTSVGLSPNDAQCVLPNFSWVSSGHYCCDIIYKPSKTMFLKKCESQGGCILNGKGMLAAQGALAFNMFFDDDSYDVFSMMRKVLD